MKIAEERGVDVSELDLAVLQTASTLFERDVHDVTAVAMVAEKNSVGS